MSAIIDLTITNNGAILLDLMQTKIGTFTNIVIGNGYCLEDFSEVESLVSPVASLEINSYEKDSDSGVVTLHAEFDNTVADTDFYYRELGLFALDPDTNKEILFAYGNANDHAEYIPVAETKKATIRKSIVIAISVANTDNVEVSINTAYEIYQKLSEKGIAGGYASLGEDGKVPKEQLPEMSTDTIGYIDLGTTVTLDIDLPDTDEDEPDGAAGEDNGDNDPEPEGNGEQPETESEEQPDGEDETDDGLTDDEIELDKEETETDGAAGEDNGGGETGEDDKKEEEDSVPGESDDEQLDDDQTKEDTDQNTED